jgi:ribosomal protein S18 acetylase RimI-like enzyme
MLSHPIEIRVCSTALSADALALVLGELSPEQRHEIAPQCAGKPVEGLVVAVEDSQLRGAAWCQRQPGNTALFWPPQLADTASSEIVNLLCGKAAETLDAAGIRMAQALLRDRDASVVPALVSAGFACLTDLLYLSWDVMDVRAGDCNLPTLEFEPFHESQQKRLSALVETTYTDTQDCVAMNGRRPMNEVLEGYRATGAYRPENWWFARDEGQDVGMLLLADHQTACHWELMYMGVVPIVRRRRFGSAILRHAQRCAFAARTQRIVLGVDVANSRAIRLYEAAGFRAWDKRTVFVRFGG